MKKEFTEDFKVNVVCEALRTTNVNELFKKYDINKKILDKFIDDLDELEPGTINALKYDIAISENLIDKLNETISKDLNIRQTLINTIELNFQKEKAEAKLEQVDEQLKSLYSYRSQQQEFLDGAIKELNELQK